MNNLDDLFSIEEISTHNKTVLPKSKKKSRAASEATGNTIQKYYINVPFSEKDQVKELGAKWDGTGWYYTDPSQADKFARWPLKIQRKVMTFADLTNEQQRLIQLVKQGKNVLVDACIGSGKTTTIQVLCNELKDKRILYLTYNKLLKIDAQEKITHKKVEVNNYHGFAYRRLREANISSGISDLIQTFIKYKPELPQEYDLLILDEYQDIDTEISEMLEYIKQCNPGIQIVAVGDMAQKIYDKTSLNVEYFIEQFLDQYIQLNFTKCFRISSDLAEMLGRIWQKDINGMNPDCQIGYMQKHSVVRFLSTKQPSEILCLGARTGDMAKVLNELEDRYPLKFNKRTVYASIQDEDGGTVTPSSNTAIFTTFDGAKGLERDICVVFDFTEGYWISRIEKPMTKYEILRNVFCVAASRGKKQIIFVEPTNDDLISEETLSTPINTKEIYEAPFNISEMFNFKYKEDIENCYALLETKDISPKDRSIIDVASSDELIDLSPCIGIWQEAAFFKNYDIDNQIRFSMVSHPDRPQKNLALYPTIEQKILLLTMLETAHERYEKQVKIPFITTEQKEQIFKRLSTVFIGNEVVQSGCGIMFQGLDGIAYDCIGRCDVDTDSYIYELKFKDELKHEDFLQLACYLVAKQRGTGILWNVKNNQMFEVRVPNKRLFMHHVVYTITKHTVGVFVEIDDKEEIKRSVVISKLREQGLL